MKKLLYYLKPRILTLFVLSCFILPAIAQEPQNNLGKSLEQLKVKFPELKYWTETSEGTTYKYGDEMAFVIKNNRLVSETMYVEGNGSYPYDWFLATVKAFMKTNYIHKIGDEKSVIFIYSYFQVHIMYSSFDNSSLISYDYLPKYK